MAFLGIWLNYLLKQKFPTIPGLSFHEWGNCGAYNLFALHFNSSNCCYILKGPFFFSPLDKGIRLKFSLFGDGGNVLCCGQQNAQQVELC